MVDLNQPFVNLNAALVDENRVITSYWQQFFKSLWDRTGGAQGVSSADAVAAAAAALVAANAALALANAALKKAQNLADLTNVPTARNNLGLSALATAAPVAGWADPTGAGSRAAFDMNFAQVISAGYVQAEVQALSDQVTAIGKRIGQSILDDKTIGAKAA